jgi:hypothetical protein
MDKRNKKRKKKKQWLDNIQNDRHFINLEDYLNSDSDDKKDAPFSH